MANQADYEARRAEMLSDVIPSPNVREALAQLKQYSGSEKSLMAMAYMQLANMQQLMTALVKDQQLMQEPDVFVHALEEDRKKNNIADADDTHARVAEYELQKQSLGAEFKQQFSAIDDVFAKLNGTMQQFEQLRASYVKEVFEQMVTFCAVAGKASSEQKELANLTEAGAFDKLIIGKGVLRTHHFQQLKDYLVDVGDDWGSEQEASQRTLNLRDNLLGKSNINAVIRPAIEKLGVCALNELERARLIFVALIILCFDPEKLEDREMSFGSITEDASNIFAEDVSIADKMQEALDQLQHAMNAFESKVLPHIEQLVGSLSHLKGAQAGLEQIREHLKQDVATRKAVLQDVVELQLKIQQKSSSESGPQPSP